MRTAKWLPVAFLILVFFVGCQRESTRISEELTAKPTPPIQPSAPAPQKPAAPEKPQTTRPVEALSFANVYFGFDRYDLTQEARETLTQHAKKLIQNPQIRLDVEGHCDERGTIEYNLALGQRRADTVKAFLVNLGVDPSRISTISYGKERPLDPRHTEEAWAKNRRASFVIIK